MRITKKEDQRSGLNVTEDNQNSCFGMSTHTHSAVHIEHDNEVSYF